jgi:hypothetical protein
MGFLPPGMAPRTKFVDKKRVVFIGIRLEERDYIRIRREIV